MKPTNNTYRTFFIDDEGGNKLRVQQNDKLTVLTLLLKGDKPRKIGTVTKSTRTIQMKRRKDIHLFRKGNAYGFCYYVLNNQTSIDYVSLSDELNHWKVPVKFILDNGKFLFFKEQGFEKQIFLSLEQLEQHKIKPKENSRF